MLTMQRVRLPQLLVIVAASLTTSPTPATLCTGNSVHIDSDEDGRCYVRSIPSSGTGWDGGTRVYRVGRGEDELVHSFSWYARSVAIRCGQLAPDRPDSISIVRMGYGGKAELGETSGTVTLAFLLDGEMIAEYSNMDLALITPRRGFRSACGPSRGFAKALGYRDIDGRLHFEICSYDARILSFDVVSGDLLGQRPDIFDRCGQRDSRYFRSSRPYITSYYGEAQDSKRWRPIVIE